MQMLQEAYDVMTNKGRKEINCKHASKGCDCSDCKECEANQETIEEAKKSKKPDYMDTDKDGNKKEPMKKALKDKGGKKFPMKEELTFKNLYSRVISENEARLASRRKSIS